MKITGLYIDSYGALKDKRMSFSDSVNIIEGENESGKTTLMSFIAFMLYGGSDSTDYVKASGLRSGGTMQVSTERNGDLLIKRYASVSGKKYTESVDVIHLQTMKEIRIKGSVGEFLLGINKAFFSSTALISQSGASSYSASDINSSIQNILLSANENYNTEKALKKLDETRKFFALKRGKGGLISDLNDKISEYRSELDKNIEISKKIDENKRSAEELKRKKEEYDVIYEAISLEKRARLIKKRKISQDQLKAKNELMASKEAYAQDLGEYCKRLESENVKNRLREADFAMRLQSAKISEAQANIASTQGEIEALSSEMRPQNESCEAFTKKILGFRSDIKKFHGGATLALTVFYISLVLATVLAISSNIVPAIVVFTVTALSLCIGTLLLGKKKSSENELSKLMSACGYDINTDIRSIENDYKNVALTESEIERKREYIVQKQAELDSANENYLSAKNSLISILAFLKNNRTYSETEPSEKDILEAEEEIEGAFRDLQTLIQDIRILKNEIRELIQTVENLNNLGQEDISTNPKLANHSDIELDKLTESLKVSIENALNDIHQMNSEAITLNNSFKDPETINALISEAEARLAERKEQYAITLLAEEALAYSSENIKSSVTPNLLAYADKMFSRTTSERYSGLAVGDDLSPKGLHGNAPLKKDELSYGTNEIMYLTFRAALILLLCKKELPPLLLDETFAHVDNKRTREMLKILSETKLQSFVFTCNDRENRISEGIIKGINHIIL